MYTASNTRPAIAGFTLLEVIFTVVILGILTKFAMMKLVTPATLTLPAQAQSVADVIRRAQSLAVVRGQRTSVSVAASGVNGRVTAACVASAPCSTDTSLTVSQGAVVGSASTIYFNSLGQPVNSAGTALTSDANFTLSYTTGGNTATYTVTVAALTGRVSVSP
jgi:prepilin-type N-terminal cleavage/methylation domain-containing protein